MDERFNAFCRRAVFIKHKCNLTTKNENMLFTTTGYLNNYILFPRYYLPFLGRFRNKVIYWNIDWWSINSTLPWRNLELPSDFTRSVIDMSDTLSLAKKDLGWHSSYLLRVECHNVFFRVSCFSFSFFSLCLPLRLHVSSNSVVLVTKSSSSSPSRIKHFVYSDWSHLACFFRQLIERPWQLVHL